MAKTRQYIERAKARNARRFIGEKFQVPEAVVFHPGPGMNALQGLKFEGKPDDTILDIVRRRGFRFDWDSLIWIHPQSNEDCTSDTIKQIEQLIERLLAKETNEKHSEIVADESHHLPAHSLKDVAAKYVKCGEKRYKDIAEVDMVPATQVARLKAQNAALKAEIAEKNDEIAVLRSELHGRSAATEAAPVKRGPVVYCQNDEDGGY